MKVAWCPCSRCGKCRTGLEYRWIALHPRGWGAGRAPGSTKKTSSKCVTLFGYSLRARKNTYNNPHGQGLGQEGWVPEDLEGHWVRGFVSLKPPLECHHKDCLLYTSPSPRDLSTSRMPSSA